MLELRRERTSPFDLALTGRLPGVPVGETRFVRWAELRALPTTKLTVEGEFIRGEQEVTVVFLRDLMRALPLATDVDTLLATCSDGYVSVYTTEVIERYRPYLVLEINGKGPDHWPPPGLKFNPGPYVITVSATVVPAVKQLLDVNHKKPWSVTTLEVANYTERFEPAYRGTRADLTPIAQEGRTIWINSCASCHAGPGGMFGGTKSDRPFEVLAAHARHNAAYFKRYVRNPQGEVAGAKMEAHPHYTDAQLDALIAFITADGKQ